MSSGDTSVISTVVASVGDNKWQILIALLASSVGFIVAIVNSVAAYFRDKRHMEELDAQERRFEAFKKELEDKQRRLVRFENVQELMKQYKKPLLQSAFDLQSRLANQIKSNFLYKFANSSDRDKQYGRLNMAFVISEFLGWLEVIRQEIVFITGTGDQTSALNLIIDALKFQFTGDTPVQGKSGKKDEADENWQLLQLYAGELRAIGEVMILERTFDDDNNPNNGNSSNLSIIGYAEFVRRANAEAPGECSSEEAAAWKRCREKLQQDTLSPLMSYIDTLMTLDDEKAPKRRITVLQVLLCKLIDVLDGAVPFDVGPEYDLENGDEPRYIPRDFRLTPLVGRLSAPQREWLAAQRFMDKVHPVERLAYDDWASRLQVLSPEDKGIYTKLAFPGFREDLHVDGKSGHVLTQLEREAKLGKDEPGKSDRFPGAFPPREPRTRKAFWWAALDPTDYEHWYKQALSRGRIALGVHLHKTGSSRRTAADKQEAISWSILRKRKHAAVAVKPEPHEASYDIPNRAQVLSNPSVQQLRTGHNTAAPSPSASMRAMTPVQVVNGNRAATPLLQGPNSNRAMTPVQTVNGNRAVSPLQEAADSNRAMTPVQTVNGNPRATAGL